MKLIDLTGIWTLQAADGGEVLSCKVPGGVASALLEHGQMPDPYWRDQETAVQPVFDKDYIFRRSFTVNASQLQHETILLRCDGLDTLAEIMLNETKIGTADNMHRTWRYDVKDALRVGDNTLEILFHTPAAYLKEHPSPIGKPYSVLRKAACMFGWDWGICLPDSGIWKEISLEAVDGGRLEGVIFHQEHGDGHVSLHVTPVCDRKAVSLQVQITLKGPDGTKLGQRTVPAGEAACFAVDRPQLWWPLGYGAQPLYTVETELLENGVVCDKDVRRVGLRSIVLDRTELEDGSRYSFVVNGVPVFFRGENLIIQDALLDRSNPERWRRLIRDCLKSNLNGIRVWGGACYPPDLFYDLCDEAGLLVYQDMMFACSFYAVGPEFLENVRAELNDNLSRIGHHACIAQYCGNNEIDGVYTVGGATDPETVALRRLFGAGEEPLPAPVRQALWAQYTPLFLQLIPEAAGHWSPDVGYVHSSPSVRQPGGANSFFDYLSDGDMHYYLQYNGNAPYQRMRDFRCRFMTEMGFQSYPSMKTINAFTKPEDRLPYTPVMYAHQKCAGGNETIELYLSRDYCIPQDFSDYVYLSQLQAGEIMRYSVEHFRRDNAYCRGMILWQLNDCWPVVSWSGIDYYGRWKALQYYIRRFYAPVLLSACEDGGRAALWLTNETPQDHSGELRWQLMDLAGEILDAGEMHCTVAAGESRAFAEFDYTDLIGQHGRENVYLRYWFDGGDTQADGTVLFVLPREFHFRMPQIEYSVREEETLYRIDIRTDRFAKSIALDTSAGDCIFSDNYFDLAPGECRTILAEKADCSGIADAAQLEKTLQITTLNAVLLCAKEQDRGKIT